MENKQDFVIENGVLTEYNGPGGDVVIPEGVTEIKGGESGEEYNGVFCEAHSVTDVTFPISLKVIGPGAFFNSGLTRLVIPGNVEKISPAAFQACYDLTSLTIKEGVKIIGGWSFLGCSRLTDVRLPSTLEWIGDDAFKNTPWLANLEPDENNLRIAGYVLLSAQGCSKETVVPQGVRLIGNGAFAGSEVTNVILPDTVTTIGADAFRACASLNSITMPLSAVEIGMNAFRDCVNLTRIVIPDRVKKLWGGTFAGCTSLDSISLPKTLEDLGSNLFGGCDNLMEISVDVENPYYRSVDGILLKDSVVIRCPPQKRGAVILPDGITRIESSAFQGCAHITEIKVPDSVRTIGKGAFEDCTGLHRLAFPAGLKRLNGAVCAGCTGLEEVAVPKCLTEIDFTAFSGCTKLAEIAVDEKNSVYSCADGMLIKKNTLVRCLCGREGDVTIPKRVSKIEEWAFLGCTGLQSVTILADVKKIDRNLFKDCRPVLLAPHIPIANFDKEDKPGACIGFAKLYLENAELDEEIKAGYLKYIKGQRKRLFPMAVQHEELLRLMFAEKMLDRKDIDPLLEECEKQKNTAAKAAVLEYAHQLDTADSGRSYKL